MEENTTTIKIPQDCEVDKIETQDGAIVVTFKKKERKLPKTWKEFCKIFPVEKKEFYIDDFSRIFNRTDVGDDRNREEDKNMLPDRATAEAVLALCQLIQLRNAYNGDWIPFWKDTTEYKYAIEFRKEMIVTNIKIVSAQSPLYFKSKELSDEFLRNFRPLIEKLKPLYGIFEF